MKKILSFSLALVVCSSAFADKVQIFQSTLEGPNGETAIVPLMGLSMSPNSKYVCGALENGAGIFVAERESGEVKWVISDEGDGELRHVDNQGLAIGISNTFDFATAEVGFIETPEGVEGLKYVLAEDLTEDGEMYVGSFIYSTGYESAPVYTKDKGLTWQMLPVPTKEEIGSFFYPLHGGAAAKFVSGDGKVIYGMLGNFHMPMLWIQNENGDYEYDFFPARYVKSSAEDLEDPTKPLHSVSALYGMNLSNNGRYALMQASVKDDEFHDPRTVPAVYDIQEKELKVYSEVQDFDISGRGLWPTCIADDGTFIGCVGQPYFASMASFIWKAGDSEAKLWTSEFPHFNKKLGESDELGFNVPTLLSADAKYVGGYTFYSTDYYDDSWAGYVTYVIDTEAPYDAVEEISSEAKVVVPTAVYSLDGQRLNGMTKGLNIVRMSDGSVRKILVK